MTVVAFGAFILVAGLHAWGLVRALISIGWPEHRLWPPRDDAEPLGVLRQRVTSVVMSLGVPLVAVLDWNSFVFDHGARYVIAAGLMALGLSAGRAHRYLGTSESLGQAPPGGELVLRTGGPYAVTRNPQYVAATPIYLGVAIGSNSLLALLAGGLMIAGLIANVFAEEPWMRDRFGEEYDDYCRRVPRFLPKLWRERGKGQSSE